MQITRALLVSSFLFLFSPVFTRGQAKTMAQRAEEVMLRATKFMVEEVSTNGGFVWYYTPDLSRRWGEMEAYPTMIWTQDGGTVSVGHTLLDAYRATGNEYFYQCAEKAAFALIWGQSNEGGWNYMVDFAGDRSLKTWYNTIGKNGWRLEEFQHYYGNDTYDDDVTSDAARFLLRMYIEKLDPKFKPALDKAINFVLKSQYPVGGWPQRYPLKYDFNKTHHPDYSSYHTFNDDVIGENVNFLIQCYQTLGEQRFLDPIKRGMDFYMLSQQANGAWGQQYNMELEPAGARSYEPAAYLPRATYGNAMLLLKFYQFTGDRRYIARIPDAIRWLEKVRLPATMSENGKFTHSLFVEVGTDRPIFVHRKGSNVIHGSYFVDYNDTKLLAHMQGKGNINTRKLKDDYDKICALTTEEVTKNSPLLPGRFDGQGTPQSFYQLNRDAVPANMATEATVKEIVTSLDNRSRWLVKHVMISNPYAGDGQNKEATDEFASSHVGDKTDTSPYRDPSDNDYISTPRYIQNMNLLTSFILSIKKQQRVK